MQNKHLQTYLHRIEWDKKQFTSDQLETMLVASCLRFLGGITDIDFVLGLSGEIYKRQGGDISLSLRYATAILHDLAEKLSKNTILSTDKDMIKNCINNAQGAITKRKFH